jgi:hypothetical protein
MSFDNEFDEPFDNNLEYGKTYDPSHQDGVSSDAEISQDGFDPMEITDPLSAYFFLSDDAQDEIDGSDRKRMKCGDCKHRFMGEIYDSCPKCNSINT